MLEAAALNMAIDSGVGLLAAGILMRTILEYIIKKQVT